MSYPIVRTAPAGTVLALTGRDASGEWLQTAEGLWVFAALVEGAPTSLGVVGVGSAPAVGDAPQRSGGGVVVPVVAATPVPAVPAVPVAVNAEPSGNASVQVVVVVNSSTNEILEIRNTGGAPIDIGRWWLDGSKGEDSCVIPAGIVLAPGAGYQVATGDSQPQGAGVKCGDKPIWNNGGEVVYLHGVDGSVVVEVEAGRR
jgi:hypothetical protein